jgi:hypothetical protein
MGTSQFRGCRSIRKRVDIVVATEPFLFRTIKPAAA